MKNKNLLVSLFLTFALASCGSNNNPTPEPTAEPTVEPTVEPTTEQTPEPTSEPTAEPTIEPTSEPTVEPTIEPTPEVPEGLLNLTDSFIISNINDTFNENEDVKYYKLIADHDDEYAFITYNYLKLTLLDSDFNVITEDYDEIVAPLLKNQEVYLIAEQMNQDSDEIMIEAYYLNDPIKLPYQTNFIEEEIDTSYSDERGILKPAEISYKGREGGTYIYSNNPEQFVDKDLNKCLMKNENLSGEVYMTYEHANYSSNGMVYLGYKLVNEEDHDIYVTVENVGYQAGGTWFGQLAWYDFYNTKFTLPADYLINGSISGKYAGYDYAYQDYNPRVYTPTTYKIPAHESFFVIGGTNGSSYNNIDVGNTANKPLGKIKCCNGNVKFDVTQGEVTGMMFIYTNEKLISDDMDEVGYVTERDGKNYASQYSGIAHHHGVIDSHIKWEFNDNTSSRLLPVTYTNKLATSTSNKKPYEAYDLVERQHSGTSWMTHLNPQNDNRAVGMDLVEFICRTTDKKEVIIDNYHADGCGEPANTANWMIEYQDHFTFVNKGNEVRKVKLRIKDHGTLATLLREKDGTVIETYYSVGLADQAYNEYLVEIQPQSVRQVVLDYCLVACSYGSVMHEVKLF